MGDWSQINEEILSETADLQRRLGSVVDTVRRKHLHQLSEYTGRNTIVYYSSFLSKPRYEEAGIVDDDKNGFMQCVYGLKREKGLDLVLHTPGGNVAATESLVHYLREMFGGNIRAIVPQIAMSAGTMLACSCKTILMGKHSNLGPIDPHIEGFPAESVITEFKRAFVEICEDGRKASVWAPILNRYTPSFLTQCEYAVDWSRSFVQDCLEMNMFHGLDNAKEKAASVVAKLSSAADNKTHSKHLHYQDCDQIGLNVEMIEKDPKLQDLILTVHHAYCISGSNSPAIKIIENQEGKAILKNVAPQMPLAFGFGGPAQPGRA